MSEPRERPILMSAPMVRRTLADLKWHTRRAVKGQSPAWDRVGEEIDVHDRQFFLALGTPDERGMRPILESFECPYGQPSDRLWVRETWADMMCDPPIDGIVYRADSERDNRLGGIKTPWRPSIHMPRWASRITLEITEVRVERLQDISEAHAIAEGVINRGRMDGEPWSHCHVPGAVPSIEEVEAVTCFSILWERINGDGSWLLNPWVWVIAFRRIDQEKARG